MPTLANRTLFITGGSRGIGLAIALRAARDGANVVIAAKSDVPNPKLPGTIHSAAAEIEAAGGMAEEFRADGIAVNALWPRTVIHTAALAMIPGVDPTRCRGPQIMADAAHAVATTPSRQRTGRFLIDEDVLREAGVTDLERYAVEPGQPLLPDLFLD
jgi:NAD(P)-dependent dehydrogenase (short-subunit alcohol dehydrogenase family)